MQHVIGLLLIIALIGYLFFDIIVLISYSILALAFAFLVILNVIPTVRFWIFKYGNYKTGLPEKVAEQWQRQQTNVTCAIACQKIILSISGISRDERSLSQRQQAFGKFDCTKGSSSITHLLNGYGMKTKSELLHSKEAFSKHIWTSLRKGKLVLASTNSFILNNHDSFFHDKNAIPDHAVIISGLVSHSGLLNVLYCDPGSPNGALISTTLEHFYQSSNGTLATTPKIMKVFKLPLTKKLPKKSSTANFQNNSNRKTIVACGNCDTSYKIPKFKKVVAICPNCGIKQKFKP